MRKIFSLLLFISFIGIFAQSPGYYNQTEGKTGDELKAALHEIINNHIDFSYSDAKYILEYAQEDPTNSSNLLTFYTGLSIPKGKSSWGTTGNLLNREHVWAKSHGDFSDIRPMDGDAHNLHAADATVNVTRSNYDFDYVEGGTYITEADAYYGDGAFEPSDREKGEVARTIMYMAVRYEGTDDESDLELADKVGTYPKAEHGKLSTLLQWNRDFPPSDFERRRNDRIEQSQGNRNPFIDYPEWADMIWGDKPSKTVAVTEVNLQTPHPKPNITVSINFKTKNATSVEFLWGSEYNNISNSAAVINETGSPDVNTVEFTPVGIMQNMLVHCKIIAKGEETSDTIYSNFRVAPDEELVTITSVQGTGNSSPLAGQVVTIGGIITANFDNAFTIQNTADKTGMTVYSIWRGHIGDSVIVKGKVYEYKGLTEISPASLVYNYGSKAVITPDTLSIAELNEANESEVIVINNVNFTGDDKTFSIGGGTYVINDGDKDLNVYVRYNSRLGGKAIPSGTVAVKGIYTEYDGAYQLIINDISWITRIDDNTPPEIVKVEVMDKDWVYIHFNESITAESAENAENFSFEGGLNILGTYHYPPNKAIIMVGNLQAKSYTVKVKGIEDLSGNILEETTEEFTSSIANALDNAKLSSTQLFPNPSNGNIQLRSQKLMSDVKIFNLMGVQMDEVRINQLSEVSLNLECLSSGVYFMQVTHADKSSDKLRFTIQ